MFLQQASYTPSFGGLGLRETAWLEIGVDSNSASKGHRGYEGIVFKPPGSSGLPVHPVFVKELELHR